MPASPRGKRFCANFHIPCKKIPRFRRTGGFISSCIVPIRRAEASDQSSGPKGCHSSTRPPERIGPGPCPVRRADHSDQSSGPNGVIRPPDHQNALAPGPAGYAERIIATSRVSPMVLFNHLAPRTNCQRRLAAGGRENPHKMCRILYLVFIK